MGNIAVNTNLIGYGATKADAKKSLIYKINAIDKIDMCILRSKTLDVKYEIRNGQYKCYFDATYNGILNNELEHYGPDAFSAIESEFIFEHGEKTWRESYYVKTKLLNYSWFTIETITHFLKIDGETHKILHSRDKVYVS